jgi:hypothetical protein
LWCGDSTVGDVTVRDLEEVAAAAAGPLAGEVLGVDEHNPLVVDLRDTDSRAVLPAMTGLVSVVIGIGPFDTPHRSAVDVLVEDAEAAAEVVAAAQANPLAATSLALHLRASAPLPVTDALVAESATYSTLQAGPEHRRWLAGHPPRRRPGDDTRERVRLERDGDRISITLVRSDRRNAVDAAMQAALVDALAVAADPTVTSVTLDGEGPTFSAGGDLDEFGTLADPAHGHLLRLARSPARGLAAVADKTTAIVHGACYGAGVELAAFAGTVVARPDTSFTLPEIGMGLVPGAGGTVSISRRIGRHRTAWFAITGCTVDVDTALAWRLVDTLSQ